MLGADPLLLESVVDDPALRKTIFVIVHGGWPFTKETAFLFTKPNVYADYSEQTWLLSPRELAENLRTWLEWFPERVMFGTDLYPGSAQIDWEEIGWVTTHDARQGLRVEESRRASSTGLSPLTDLAVQISRSEFLKQDSQGLPRGA